MPFDPRLIKESFALVEDRANDVAGHFYALLFLENPGMRDMFPPMMGVQRERLVAAVVRFVNQAHEPQSLIEYLRQLGRDHRKHGVRPQHYDAMVRSFIGALRHFAGSGWTAQMEAAWLSAFEFVSQTMVAAAQDAAKSTPAYWSGRVVAHHRPNASVALLTVQTDHPYPFRPGQAAAIETLRWPRVWRPYSIANAPRADGLLTFQVRAVDGGWVSSALVNHTQLGDTVRLGPAAGAMVCNSLSNRDVLMIGGGTGIAPIMAIVEDMVRWNTNRRVTVYYGARKTADLYALDALEALRAHAPWLTIVPCVSHDAWYSGERGLLPDVLARHGADRFNWAEHDVYVSGSAEMMRVTLKQLLELEIPAERIRFDAFGRQSEVQHGFQREEHVGGRKVLSSSEPRLPQLPQRTPQPLPRRLPQTPRVPQPQVWRQASKSSATSSEVGSDWQVSTKPPIFSSGSRA
ncbi:globin domain-containing protein [Actinocrinis sp.]|uniref:globin domain-containing protein n=1 Tax=Actinocrinis sp. TaxID=1920516 RepID=UPI002D5FAF32|nr:globin domain-containing protein [Actinocrinis sp.]HZP54281.1 globin domain-containing protein [Actinocrinis sp.]